MYGWERVARFSITATFRNDWHSYFVLTNQKLFTFSLIHSLEFFFFIKMLVMIWSFRILFQFDHIIQFSQIFIFFFFRRIRLRRYVMWCSQLCQTNATVFVCIWQWKLLLIDSNNRQKRTRAPRYQNQFVMHSFFICKMQWVLFCLAAVWLYCVSTACYYILHVCYVNISSKLYSI